MIPLPHRRPAASPSVVSIVRRDRLRTRAYRPRRPVRMSESIGRRTHHRRHEHRCLSVRSRSAPRLRRRAGPRAPAAAEAAPRGARPGRAHRARPRLARAHRSPRARRLALRPGDGPHRAARADQVARGPCRQPRHRSCDPGGAVAVGHHRRGRLGAPARTPLPRARRLSLDLRRGRHQPPHPVRLSHRSPRLARCSTGAQRRGAARGRADPPRHRLPGRHAGAGPRQGLELQQGLHPRGAPDRCRDARARAARRDGLQRRRGGRSPAPGGASARRGRAARARRGGADRAAPARGRARRAGAGGRRRRPGCRRRWRWRRRQRRCGQEHRGREEEAPRTLRAAAREHHRPPGAPDEDGRRRLSPGLQRAAGRGDHHGS